MADYDRGAYTPQTDAPLAFDPRRPSERRPMPMALIGSAVVLVVLLAGVAMVYRSGVRHAGDGPRPVGEPVMSVKTVATPDAATSKGAPANLGVYDAAGANTADGAPVFAPPAEQPAARPAPKPATLAMLAKPQAAPVRRPTPAQSQAAQLAEDAQVKPATSLPPAVAAKSAPPLVAHAARTHALDAAEVAAAGMTRTSAAHAAAEDDAATPPAAALRKPAPPAATVAPTDPGDPTGSVVQIGAFSSNALATQGYADVAGSMTGQMSGKSRHVQSVQRDGKTLFRTWVAGFASHADAKAFCDALKAKGKICIVKG